MDDSDCREYGLHFSAEFISNDYGSARIHFCNKCVNKEILSNLPGVEMQYWYIPFKDTFEKFEYIFGKYYVNLLKNQEKELKKLGNR